MQGARNDFFATPCLDRAPRHRHSGKRRNFCYYGLSLVFWGRQVRTAVTRYARSGEARIAYQVVGHGSLDLVLMPGFPSNLEILWEDPDYSRLIKRAVSVRCDGSAAADLSHTAAGRLDGYWEQEIEPWDVAAGALILTEAGGQVSLFDGRPFDVFGRSILATNAHLHGALLRELGGTS